VTLDGSPDLSGVATDGSHVLYLLTSTGAQFFTINAKDNGAKTVTTDVAPAGTSTGRTWAIGGKRATFDSTSSRNLFATATILDGWTVILESNQALNAQLTIGAQGDTITGPITVKGDSETSHRVITQAANAVCFNLANGATVRLENLKFQSTNAVKTSGHGITAQNVGTYIKNCIFGDVTNTLQNGINGNSSPNLVIEDCQFIGCLGSGISSGTDGNVWVTSSDIFGGSGAGINHNSAGLLHVEDCLIWGNALDGIVRTVAPIALAGMIAITGSVIHGNGGDGIDLSTSANISGGSLILNNNITGNGGYGINGHASIDAVKYLIDYNNFGSGVGIANSGGAMNNVTANGNDLAVDPGYANAAVGNFRAGTAIKAEGIPDAARTIGAGQGGTTAYIDIGIQRRDGTGVQHPFAGKL
jgi:hypothetical protein